jgi:hypothetical protein
MRTASYKPLGMITPAEITRADINELVLPLGRNGLRPARDLAGQTQLVAVDVQVHVLHAGGDAEVPR